MVARILISVLLAGAAIAAPQPEFKAGFARAVITPKQPIRMAGYAARTHPSEGVALDLWAKALAIVPQKGKPVVMITLDLLTVPHAFAEDIAARVKQRYGIDRDRLSLSASHTHAGPFVAPHPFLVPDDPDELRIVNEYGRKLADTVVDLAGSALRAAAPAELRFGRGSAGFSVNRRQKTPEGYKIGVNPDGPVDHSVPVLLVSGEGGQVRGILFGYACHNTTTQADFYRMSGDYAGFAQAELEKSYPGATAMFVALCAGDQNPNPRGTLELAEKYGTELAAGVESAIGGSMRTLHGPLRTAFLTTSLEFAPHTRETFAARLKSDDAYVTRHARYMLRTYDEGHPIRSAPYPVQAIRFGRELTFVLLGGEVVIDYCLRAKREYPGEDLVVAGYSNDVMSYIPSKRILHEGGYEADSSMLYYGMPGPYDDTVEETVFSAIHTVMKKVGR